MQEQTLQNKPPPSPHATLIILRTLLLFRWRGFSPMVCCQLKTGRFSDITLWLQVEKEILVLSDNTVTRASFIMMDTSTGTLTSHHGFSSSKLISSQVNLNHKLKQRQFSITSTPKTSSLLASFRRDISSWALNSVLLLVSPTLSWI